MLGAFQKSSAPSAAATLQSSPECSERPGLPPLRLTEAGVARHGHDSGPDIIQLTSTTDAVSVKKRVKELEEQQFVQQVLQTGRPSSAKAQTGTSHDLADEPGNEPDVHKNSLRVPANLDQQDGRIASSLMPVSDAVIDMREGIGDDVPESSESDNMTALDAGSHAASTLNMQSMQHDDMNMPTVIPTQLHDAQSAKAQHGSQPHDMQHAVGHHDKHSACGHHDSLPVARWPADQELERQSQA